ncbi:MAG: integrin alpha [Sandaracinaceae bacterium]|nr:integrin alpha [Sandaracinaceae bacterium]
MGERPSTRPPTRPSPSRPRGRRSPTSIATATPTSSSAHRARTASACSAAGPSRSTRRATPRSSAPWRAPQFGWTISTGADLDRDGFLDLVVGAPQAPAGGSYRGAVYAYRGDAGLTLPIFATVLGSWNSAQFGSRVLILGQQDPTTPELEVLVAEPYASFAPYTQNGGVWRFRGSSGLPALTGVTGPSHNTFLGRDGIGP